jgi:hypothetical protein
MNGITSSKNKNSEKKLIVSTLSPDERIRFLANIIVDKILEDQKSGQNIFQKISKK